VIHFLKRNYKKETLAKRIINSASSLKELNYLHKPMGDIYDRMKEDVENSQKLMESWGELYEEYLENKKAFIKKYAKPNNQFTVKLIQDYTDE